MKVLVTGATGFIGTTLCGILVERGFEDKGFPPSRRTIHPDQTHLIEVFEGDVTVPSR